MHIKRLVAAGVAATALLLGAASNSYATETGRYPVIITGGTMVFYSYGDKITVEDTLKDGYYPQVLVEDLNANELFHLAAKGGVNDFVSEDHSDHNLQEGQKYIFDFCLYNSVHAINCQTEIFTA